MMRLVVGVAIGIVFFNGGSARAQGRLQQARDNIRGYRTTVAAPSSSSQSFIALPLDDDDGTGLIGLAVGAVAAATSPIWLPTLCLESFEAPDPVFLPYPYVDGHVGSMVMDNRGAPPIGWHDGNWSAIVSTEDGNDFRGINRVGGRWLVDTVWRFGAEGDVDWFDERLADGGSDSMTLGTVNAVWRFVQSDTVQFRLGAGAWLQDDRSGGHAGPDFVYGCEFYPIQPLAVSLQADAGWIGHALAVRGRLSVGANLGPVELFGGYDFLRLGTVNLQGPVLGVRFWF